VSIEKTRPAAVEAGQTLGAAQLGGPPARYTPGLHTQICENIRRGNRPVTAAQMAGIPSHVFYRWMNQGKAGDPHLWQFAEDVETACGQAEGIAVAVVTNAYMESPENAKWWLERSRPAGFSKEVNARVNGELEEFVRRLEMTLDAETFEKVMSAYAGQPTLAPASAPHAQLTESNDGTEKD
jgi:hypothetical protein